MYQLGDLNIVIFTRCNSFILLQNLDQIGNFTESEMEFQLRRQ